LPMVTRIVKWVSLAALVLMVVLWGPSASYQLPLSFVICAGAVMVVLTLFSIKRRIEIHVDNRSNLGKQVPVKL